jgi:hypothetical protein
LYLFSLFIPKSMFKGVSQCIPAVNIFYLGRFNPSATLPYHFPPIPSQYSTAFCTYHYDIYLQRCNASQYCLLYHPSFFQLIWGLKNFFVQSTPKYPPKWLELQAWHWYLVSKF